MRDTDTELRVGDAMTRGVICVEAGDSVFSAAQVMEKNDISSVIVTRKGEGVGIITERDILGKIVTKSKDPKKVKVSEIMTKPLITIKPSASIDDAARLMRDRDIRRLVVEEKGKVIGVISEFDIVRIEPALHLLVREHSRWNISDVDVDEAGSVTGICEVCGNYSDDLKPVSGRMTCEDCME